MRKNLFFAAALALVSFANVAAQETVWGRTVACGQGEEMVTEGKKARMHKGSTPLIKNAGATGVRFTVIETAPNSEIKGGGPCFSLGEMQIFDAEGNAIAYEVTSNADHNTMSGAGNDGQGYPALNDGVIEQGNYWHSTWSTQAPYDYHYLEFTFAEPVDAYQLVWYTRPGIDKNNPSVVGLTNPGDAFTADMCYAEFNFSVGAQTTTINPSKFYVIQSNSGVEYDEYNRETGEVNVTHDDGTGPRYLNGTGKGSVDASPAAIVRFVPAGEDVYLLQWAISGVYVGSGNYNGLNGTASSTTNLYSAVPVSVTVNGDNVRFSYDVYYNNEPITLWLGSDPRSANNGRLGIMDTEHMEENVERGWCEGFSLPLGFDFTLYEANVADDVLPEMSIDLATAAEKMLGSTIEKADYYYEQFTSKPDSIWLALNLNDGHNDVYAEWWSEIADCYEGDIEDFNVILTEAKEAVAAPKSFADLYYKKLDFAPAFSYFLSFKADWYTMWFEAVVNEELSAYPFSEYPNLISGTYPSTQKAVLEGVIENVINPVVANPEKYSVSQIEAVYTSCEGAIASFLASKVKLSEFPAILDLTGTEKANEQGGANMHYPTPDIVLGNKVKGVRVTFLEVTVGSAAANGLYGGYPMIALGELELRDGNGEKVELTASNFKASHVEIHEGFECNEERLCDGVLGGAGSYYHSPWSGAAPTEYINIDILFPYDMDAFSLNFVGRDKATTGGKHSLNPTKVAITNYGEGYDPAVFAERPWDELAGNQITSVDEITDNGLYLIRGMLWANEAAGAVDAYGNPLPDNSCFMSATSEHSKHIAATRANCAYLIRKVEGTDQFTIYSLSTAQYWATSNGNSYISQTADYDKAAKVNIVPAESELENTFVIYEYQEGRVTTSTVPNAYGAEAEQEFETPYSTYIHKQNGVAARPTVAPKPGEGANVPYVDADGDAYCFNKKNGEGEWQIYKFNMNHKDYYWLLSVLNLPENLGIKFGTDPGCTPVSEAYEAAVAEAEAFVATADTVDTTAKKHVDALLAHVPLLSASKNPIIENTPYVLVATLPFFENTGSEKVMSTAPATVEGVDVDAPVWGSMPAAIDENVQFVFEAAAVETENTAEAGNYYYIKNVALNQYINCSGSGIYFVDEKEGNHFYVNNVKGAVWAFTRPGSNIALHQGGHNNGKGSGGELFYWNQDTDASQWYIMSVDNFITKEPVAIDVIDITPEAGDVEALSEVVVTFSTEVALDETKSIKLVAEAEEEEYNVTAQVNADDETQLVITINNELADGTYKLVIEEGAVVTADGQTSEAMELVYNVKKSEVDAEILRLRTELLAAVDELEELIEGLEGTEISNAHTLVNEIRERIEEYTKPELRNVKADVNSRINSISHSTTIGYTGEKSFNSAKRTYTLPFVMETSITNFTAFQCNIHLPKGFSIAKDDDGNYDVTLNRTRVSASHTIVAEKQQDGSYLIASYSSTNAYIKGYSGELFYISIEVDENVKQGEHQISGDCTIFSTPEGKEMSAEFISGYFSLYLQGDANGDNVITISDVVFTVNALLGKESDKFVHSAADINADGQITISDVVNVVNILLGAKSENANASTPTALYDDAYKANAKTTAAGCFHVNNAIINNNEATLFVKLDKADLYTAIQFDINLPEGVSIKDVTVNGNHTVAFNENRIVAYSLNNSVFDADEDIMVITLNVKDDIENTFVVFENIYAASGFTETRLNSTGVNIGNTTNIAGTEGNVPKVYTENSCIVIEAKNNGTAQIASANGIVYNAVFTVGRNRIAIEHKGLYIVNINDTAIKVIVQ